VGLRGEKKVCQLTCHILCSGLSRRPPPPQLASSVVIAAMIGTGPARFVDVSERLTNGVPT
jgi:hypothetical protein